MTPVEQFTWQFHADRCAELFQMALTVIEAQDMPKSERTLELDRLLKRIASHEGAMQISIEDFQP